MLILHLTADNALPFVAAFSPALMLASTVRECDEVREGQCFVFASPFCLLDDAGINILLF